MREDFLLIIRKLLTTLAGEKDPEMRRLSIFRDPAIVVALEEYLNDLGISDTDFGRNLILFTKKLQKAFFVRELDNLERLGIFVSDKVKEATKFIESLLAVVEEE